jgi:hypothetical protein
MFDTVSLAFLFSHIPFTEKEFLDRGWRKEFAKIGSYKWVYNEGIGDGSPHLSFVTLRKPGFTKVFLVVMVSLPSFLHGNNANLLNQMGIFEALRRLSVYVTEKIGFDLDATKAAVWRLDCTKDIDVEQERVLATLDIISKMNIPRFEVGSYRNETLYFHNIGKGKEENKIRTIVFYGKYKDAVAKGFPIQAQLDAYGKLRIESRYKTSRIVTRLQKSLKIECNEAGKMLTEEVFNAIMNPIELIVSKIAFGVDSQSKIIRLNKTYGYATARTLVTFLLFREKFGDNFYKNSNLGFSYNLYQNCKRKCRDSGIWTLRDTHSETVTFPEPI